ncbi:MAG: hypothetical protein IPM54_20120 [Polyangiaceae bacterium]|nr:hypothetical protein [Polyangiaceae bacterium]
MLWSYFTHRHPAFCEKPEVFDPDRWTREREEARHGHAYYCRDHVFATLRLCPFALNSLVVSCA